LLGWTNDLPLFEKVGDELPSAVKLFEAEKFQRE
jgi:hypothetical protein